MENKSTYKVLYPWQVAEKIKEGKIVRMLDRKENKIYSTNEMTATRFIQVTSNEDKTNRYEFWCYDQSKITEGTEKK